MACFTVPAAEAIVATVVKKRVKSAEAKGIEPKAKALKASESADNRRFSWGVKFSWLTVMLWGGAILLCLEHIWHGEVVPWPPFLTAMTSAAATGAMLHEIATVGVGMAVLVTAVWGVMVVVTDHVPALRKLLRRKPEAKLPTVAADVA
jgi:hypothetical protein